MEGGKLGCYIALDHDGHDLGRDARHGGQVVPIAEVGTDIDDDEDFGAHLTGHIHGQVVGDPAVHEHPVADLGGGEKPGNGHAGPDGGRQIPPAQNRCLARLDVRGHSPKGDGKAIEILDIRLVKQDFFQEDVEVLSLNETPGRLEPTVTVAQVEIDLEGLAVFLAPEGEVVRGGFVLEGLVPGHAQDKLLQFVRGEACGVEPAYDGPHAGPGDAVDGDPHLLQDLQDTDVGNAPGAAAAENEADAGSVARPLVVRAGRACPEEQKEEATRKAHQAP